MHLSRAGRKMSALTGIRGIMEDIAAAPVSSDQWINLSPGNPASIPEVTQFWRALYEKALVTDFARTSTRYGPTRGTDGFVRAVAEYFGERYGWEIGPENVLAGPGVQFLAFAAATMFTDPSRPLVLPSVPDYTGYFGLPLDAGMVVGVEPRLELHGDRGFRYTLDEDALRAVDAMGMLLVSSPSNPTGRSLRADEQTRLTELAAERGVPLLVDNAYGSPFPLVATPEADPVQHPNVINCFTLSKAGLPGERLGLAIGPPDLIGAMSAFASNTVLTGPTLVQSVAELALRDRTIDSLCQGVVRPYYRRKRLVAEKLLAEAMPSDLPWRLHVSEGGMFCWLWIEQEWFDDLAFYARLKEEMVFGVPGRHFFADPAVLDGHGGRCFRLSLSPPEADVAEGIGRLGRVVDRMRHAAG